MRVQHLHGRASRDHIGAEAGEGDLSGQPVGPGYLGAHGQFDGLAVDVAVASRIIRLNMPFKNINRKKIIKTLH